MAMTPEEEELEKFIAAMNDVQSTEKVAEGLKTKSPEQMLQEYEATIDKTISQSPEAPGIGTKVLSSIQGLTGGVLPSIIAQLATPQGGILPIPIEQTERNIKNYIDARDFVAAPLEEAARLEPKYETGGQIASMAVPLVGGVLKGGPLLAAGIREAKQLGTLGQYGINAAKQVLKVAPVLAAGGAVESVISAPVAPGTLMAPEQVVTTAIEGGKTALEMAPLTLLLGPAAKKYNFRETPSITRFKVEAPPAPLSPAKADLTRFNTGYPEAPDRVAELAAEIKKLNRLILDTGKTGNKDAIDALKKQRDALRAEDIILRPEIDTKAEELAKLEGNKNAAFTEEGFTAYMSPEQLEAAAVAKAATAKKPKFILPERSVAPYREEANRRLYPRTKPNKNKGNVPDESTTQFEDVDVGAEEKAINTALRSNTAAVKKEGSKRFWASRPDPELNLGVDEVDEIIMNPDHPLLREPIQAAASADKGYQLALREWQPNKKTPRRNAEQIILMNSGLAPLSRSKLAERTIDQYDTEGKLIPEDELLELLMENAPKELWKPVNDLAIGNNFENPNLTWKRSDSLGSGASGRVYPVIDRNGNRKVAKISFGQFDSDIALHIFEKEAARAIQNVRANATPNEKSLYLKHFPDFEQILDRPDSSTGYIFVMDELRPMNDIEKAELFDGRKILKELLEKKGYKNVDEYMNATGEDFRLPGNHNIAVMPKKPHPVPGYRRTLTATDYDNMTPRVRSLYKALEFMSGEHGIGWGDMHDHNVMINPKTGDYVVSDIGNYNQRNNNDYYRFQLEQTKAEAAGRAARQGDAEALAADIAENEARAPRPLADKATVERARAAGKDIRALPPAEMARRFKQPNRSAGAMAAEPGFYEDANGQMVFWSGQEMLSPKPKTSVSAALERLNPTAISTRRAAEPEQMELDFTERNNNVALELARRDTGLQPTTKAALPSAGSGSGRSLMVPVGSKDITDRAKGPSIIARAGRALRSATDKLNLGEFRDERNILESEYDFYNEKLRKATTEREIRTAERELSLASYDLDVHKGRYPDTQDFEAEVKEINDAQANGIYVERRKMQLMDRIIETFRKYPEIYDELEQMRLDTSVEHPVLKAYNEWDY